MEENGHKSARKQSKHLNIWYFFVTDQKAKNNIQIEYCPTDQMVGDYMTKPLHRKKFMGFRLEIMNLPRLNWWSLHAALPRGNKNQVCYMLITHTVNFNLFLHEDGRYTIIIQVGLSSLQWDMDPRISTSIW